MEDVKEKTPLEKMQEEFNKIICEIGVKAFQAECFEQEIMELCAAGRKLKAEAQLLVPKPVVPASDTVAPPSDTL